MAGQKIRIRLKAYDHEVIDSSARKIVEVVLPTGAKVAAEEKIMFELQEKIVRDWQKGL